MMSNVQYPRYLTTLFRDVILPYLGKKWGKGSKFNFEIEKNCTLANFRMRNWNMKSNLRYPQYLATCRDAVFSPLCPNKVI